jgi:hypothetical protein
MKQLTPCQQLGYKVGDKFEVIETNEDHLCGFTTGQVVILLVDDGTSNPFFQGDNSNHSSRLGVNGCLRICGSFLSIKSVKPYDVAEEVSVLKEQLRVANEKIKNLESIKLILEELVNSKTEFDKAFSRMEAIKLLSKDL